MLSKLFSEIQNYISIKSAVDVLKFILPLYITYRVTKYSVNSPKKHAIQERQFQNVYLPLYKLLCTSDAGKLTAIEISQKARMIGGIIDDNYELAFPQLHALVNDLFRQIEEDKGYQATLSKIIYQVSLDYEILKRSLGYPSQTSYEIFIRMNMKDKIISVLGWVNVIYIISPILLISRIPENKGLLFFAFYILGFIFMIRLSSAVNKMKD